jgi:hypothetical protein
MRQHTLGATCNPLLLKHEVEKNRPFRFPEGRQSSLIELQMVYPVLV